MAQHVSSGECSVVPGPDPAIRRERVYLTELARFLHHSVVALRKYARQRGLLHHSSRFPGRTAVYWVTAQTAMRLIAFARGVQGQWALDGKDFHAHQERDVMDQRKCRERKAERARQAAQTASIAFCGAMAPKSGDEG